MCQQCHLQQDQGSIVHPTQGQATLIRLPRCSTVSDLVRQAPAATVRCHCLHLRPGTSSPIPHLHHQSVPSSHRFFSQVTGGGDNPRGPWIKVRPALWQDPSRQTSAPCSRNPHRGPAVSTLPLSWIGQPPETTATNITNAALLRAYKFFYQI